ncbi:PREDICTED: uncharacterized protein LOC106820075, partial [Priapulus caudatus]|uniref:Uncharacterized protein LOC106820075 n=1 Tax=Priapulus caudatus TaxID=37621 RepID=A0ABM1F6Q1_PRICU
ARAKEAECESARKRSRVRERAQKKQAAMSAPQKKPECEHADETNKGQRSRRADEHKD